MYLLISWADFAHYYDFVSYSIFDCSQGFGLHLIDVHRVFISVLSLWPFSQRIKTLCFVPLTASITSLMTLSWLWFASFLIAFHVYSSTFWMNPTYPFGELLVHLFYTVPVDDTNIWLCTWMLWMVYQMCGKCMLHQYLKPLIFGDSSLHFYCLLPCIHYNLLFSSLTTTPHESWLFI